MKLNKKALRIGLAYDYQILPNLPKDNNDEMLDIIISENKVIKADYLSGTSSSLSSSSSLVNNLSKSKKPNNLSSNLPTPFIYLCPIP